MLANVVVKLAVDPLSLALHLFQRSLGGRGFSGFDRLAFATRAAAIPFQLDMKHTPVRRAQCLDHGVLWRGLTSRL